MLTELTLTMLSETIFKAVKQERNSLPADCLVPLFDQEIKNICQRVMEAINKVQLFNPSRNITPDPERTANDEVKRWVTDQAYQYYKKITDNHCTRAEFIMISRRPGLTCTPIVDRILVIMREGFKGDDVVVFKNVNYRIKGFSTEGEVKLEPIVKTPGKKTSITVSPLGIRKI